MPREELARLYKWWPQVALSRRSRANGYKRQEKQKTARGSNVIALVIVARRFYRIIIPVMTRNVEF